MTQQEFIASVMAAAIEIQMEYGLPAAAITAQACLETGYGKYVCKEGNKYSYNLFNIKGTGPAGSVKVKTWEVYKGKRYNVMADFRAYHSFKESFEDYVKLITGSSRYAAAAKTKDPDQYCYEIKKAGYATDPNYPKKLISIMDTFKLREMVNVPLKTEPWKEAIMTEALQKGLITSPDHKANEHADKWFVLAVALNILRMVKK